MYEIQCSLLLLRIIGYFNILAIFLGLTRFRIDFKAQRVFQSRLVARYVICANIAYLLALPVFYIYEAMYTSSQFDRDLVFLTESVNMLISFGAAALSVLLRGQREGIHLKLAETVIALDRRHFQNMRAGQRSVAHRSDHLLYFKMFALCLQTVVPFYDWLTVNDTVNVPEFLQTFYYAYSQSILAMALFMYYHWIWLLRKRFCLLNLTVLELLRRLQQMPIGSERCGGFSSTQQQCSVVEATVILLKISQIHALLNRLLSHLNRDYKVQILAVLLKNVIECISFGCTASNVGNNAKVSVVTFSRRRIRATVRALRNAAEASADGQQTSWNVSIESSKSAGVMGLFVDSDNCIGTIRC
nr:uncharacterized protein LOC118683123 isoform X2 [Bactrocera oleae]